MALVARETERLAHAGGRMAGRLAVPVVAFLRVVDADEARAFEQDDERRDAATESLFATFPRPTVSRPVGLVRDRHVTAELIQRSLEVGEIAEIFGTEPLVKLRSLAREGSVSIEAVRGVGDAGLVDHVGLRLQARGVAGEHSTGEAARANGNFPPPPRSIDEASARSVVVRDSTSGLTWHTDSGTAHRAYYPHRLIENEYGRFEVVGRVTERDAEATGSASPVAVAPKIGSEMSVPRRRTSIRRRGAAAGTLGGLETIPRQRVGMGGGGVDIEASNLDCETEHVATIHLSQDGRAVRRRMVFERGAPERLRGVFRTAGFFIYPEPVKTAPGAVRLDRDGARLLAVVLRVVIRSAYRSAERHVDVALQLDSSAGPLGAEDAIVIFDAQDGGNGVTSAIAHDGVEPLLRAAKAYLRDTQVGERWRWLLLHDDFAPASDDDLADIESIGEATAKEWWTRVAPGVLTWLDERSPSASDDGDEPRSASGASRDADTQTEPARTGSRTMRSEDLGRAVPARSADDTLVWRRHRWHFAATESGPERAYVLDLAIRDESLADPHPEVRVASPNPKPAAAKTATGPGLIAVAGTAVGVDASSNSATDSKMADIPPRVTQRIADAVQAIELARPTLSALSQALRTVLQRNRKDEDGELEERERIDRLVLAFVSKEAMPAYSGDARHRVRAVVLALATGTADEWGRTLILAELRRALIGRAFLSFDQHGQPSLVDVEKSFTASSGNAWEIPLEGGPA